MKGRFIAFEGGEGAGKSTQARLLAESLKRRGIDGIVTREPGGTPAAEAIRALLLDARHDWGARAEALLFAAARAEHVERLIAPSLAAGSWVISDRFVDSSLAYQGGGGGVSAEDIRALHRIGSGGLLPDVTILLEVSAEVAEQRCAIRDEGSSDRIGGREAEYHRRVAGAFAALAEAEPKRFARIDGGRDEQRTHEAVLAALEHLLAAAA